MMLSTIPAFGIPLLLSVSGWFAGWFTGGILCRRWWHR